MSYKDEVNWEFCQWDCNDVFLLSSDGGHFQLFGNQSNEHLSRTPGNTDDVTSVPAV